MALFCSQDWTEVGVCSSIVYQDKLDSIDAELDKEIEDTVEWALESPMPSIEEAFTDVYVE